MANTSNFSRETVLKVAVVVLIVIGALDLIRGFMHTFNIWWASENVARMTQTPDTMNLMNTFGISNFLTGALYLLIARKARELAPAVLLLVPAIYVVGIISARVTGVAAMQVSEWNGKYFMLVYLGICALVGGAAMVLTRKRGKST